MNLPQVGSNVLAKFFAKLRPQKIHFTEANLTVQSFLSKRLLGQNGGAPARPFEDRMLLVMCCTIYQIQSKVIRHFPLHIF